MKYLYLILICFLVSCEQKEVQPDTQTNNELVKSQVTNINSKIELHGKTASICNNWTAYVDLITSIENLDHSTTSLEQVIVHIDDMSTSIPETLQNQGVRSRIKVLSTRAHSYLSLLHHNKIDEDKKQRRYLLFITALDQLKIQLLDSVKAINQEQDLLKNLEENELRLDQPKPEDGQKDK